MHCTSPLYFTIYKIAVHMHTNTHRSDPPNGGHFTSIQWQIASRPSHGFFFLQQCCECCSLGLRIKSEGQSCESNPNLGYPCTLVMLSCCEGEDQLIPAELKRHPEPLPTATPEKRKCCIVNYRKHWEAVIFSLCKKRWSSKCASHSPWSN